MIGVHAFDQILKPLKKTESATPLLDLNFGFARSRVLDTALELRVFTLVAEGCATGEALSQAMDCSLRGTERLLEALVGLGLLERHGVHYTLSSLAATYLVEHEPTYIGTHLQAVMDQWDRWSRLTEAVRTGKPVQEQNGHRIRGRSPELCGHLFPLVFPVAQEVANYLELPLGARVLDVAAGGGEWGIAIGLRHEDAEILAQDEPEFLEMTRERVAQFGLEDQFMYRAAGVDDVALPSGCCDLIIVSHICRFIGPQRTQTLLRECHRVLAPGGRLILSAVMTNDDRTGPPAALMIGLSMLLNTDEGNVFSSAQYRVWLSAAGFQQIESIKVGQVPVLIAGR